MTSSENSSVYEAEVRKIVDMTSQAIRNKDVNSALSHFAPTFMLFDVVNPLRSFGSSSARKRLEEWFASFEGTLEYEIRDLNITADKNLAFSHELKRVKGMRKNGEELDMWWRATTCYCKVDGAWTIMHEHSSVPFNPETAEASLDLTP